jgi:hypothetical protein
MDKEISLFTGQVNQISSDQDNVTDQKAFYTKFLKLARSEMVAIGQKAKNKKIEDIAMRANKSLAIKRSSKAIEISKVRFAKEKETISNLENMLANGEIVAALRLMNYEGLEPVQKGKKVRPPDEKQLAALSKIAVELLSQRRDNLPSFEAAIQRNVMKKADAESALKAFEKQVVLSTDWISSFACERFCLMLDIQELVMNSSKNLHKFEVTFRNFIR